MSRIPHAEMVEIMAGLVGGKAKWLADFSRGKNKRPDWNIGVIEREMRALEQARDDYRRAAERDTKKEEAA